MEAIRAVATRTRKAKIDGQVKPGVGFARIGGMKSLGLVSVVLLTGCLASSADNHSPRFVLVADPSGISKDIPAGALALDTQTGQLCYTVQGTFTAGSPSIGMCSALTKKPAGKE
jgi:hypothetical protein